MTDQQVVVSIGLVLAGEPVERLEPLFETIGAQTLIGCCEVVIGCPEDQVAAALDGAGRNGVDVRIVPNPDGRRSPGLNRVLAASRGRVFVRLDARSRPDPRYVETCLCRLDLDPEVGIVGGAQVPTPGGRTPGAMAVARALNNPWMLGAPAYRREGHGGQVDTVYLGAFRTSELRAMGGYDERLDANEDYEVARRYRDAGRVVWLEQGLRVEYVARETLAGVVKQYAAFGESKAALWTTGRGQPAARQMVALLIAAGWVGTALLSRRRAAWTGGLGLACVVVSDHLADPAARSVALRLRASAVSVCIAGSWLGGVAVGLVRTVLWRGVSRFSA